MLVNELAENCCLNSERLDALLMRFVRLVLAKYSESRQGRI